MGTVLLNSGDMTPIKAKLKYDWVCRRPECKHEWPAKDPNKPPKVCAGCKHTNWNRPKRPVGRPRKDAKRGPKVKAKGKTKRGKK
jgi:hypothetical protein